ncbi:unnamed protein product [Closterium sp. NIES-53]
MGFPVAGTTPPLLFTPTDQSQPQLLPGSPLPTLDPHTKVSESLTERREHETRASTPVPARCVARPRAPVVPGTHHMALLPSSVPQRVVLLLPPVSSLPHVPDPESDLVRTGSPTVTRLLATVVTDPSFEFAAATTLVAELVHFAALCRLDYAASLVFDSSYPPSVEGELALGCDVLEDRQFELECLVAAAHYLVSTILFPEGDLDALDIPTPRSYPEAITGPYSSQWKIAMDAEMASWKSTGTYIDEVPPPGANIVNGMWIFRVKRPPGSPPAFKVRYIARGFSQCEGVDFFQTFSPTPKMTTLWVLLHVVAQRDYELHSLDFSKAFLQGSFHKAIWLRHPRGFTGSFPEGTHWSLRRPVYGIRHAPREWHDTLRTTIAALGFAPSTADPSPFLCTDNSLAPFYVLITRDRARHTITLTQSHMVQKALQHFDFSWSSPQLTPLATGHSLSAPPSDESVEPSGPCPELVGCLITSDMGLVLGGHGSVVPTGHSDASWADDQTTHRLTQGCSFSLGAGCVSWRSTRSSSVLTSSYEAEMYAGAMAAQELCWLTYLLTDLGERPRSPLVLYVGNKTMVALCQDQRLEHRSKHIALRYFLTRELHQRGQFCLTDAATQANTADVFTKLCPLCLTYLLCGDFEIHPQLCLALFSYLIGLRAPLPSVPARPAAQRASAPCFPVRQRTPLPIAPARPAAQRPYAPCCPVPARPPLPSASARPVAQRPRAPCCPAPMRAPLPSTRARPATLYLRAPRCPAPTRAPLPSVRPHLAAQSQRASHCPAPTHTPLPSSRACPAARVPCTPCCPARLACAAAAAAARLDHAPLLRCCTAAACAVVLPSCHSALLPLLALLQPCPVRPVLLLCLPAAPWPLRCPAALPTLLLAPALMLPPVLLLLLRCYCRLCYCCCAAAAAAYATAGPAQPPCRAAFAAALAAATAAMVTPTVLIFDVEGHPIQFEFLPVPEAPAKPAVAAGEEVQTQYRADRIAYKRWRARDAAAILAVRAHLSLDQRANFRQVP